MKKILCVLLAILLIPTALAFVGCGNQSAYDKLGEKEKRVFDVVLEFSYDFKNPSSVKVVSGDFEEEVNFTACFRIQAQNGFGSTTSGYYMIIGNKSGIDSYIDLEDDSLPSASYIYGMQRALTTDNFDYSAVNNALNEYWEKQGI